MTRKLSEALRDDFKFGEQDNADILDRLNNAAKDPELVTLDENVSIPRDKIKFIPRDIEAFFTLVALGVEIAEKTPIAGFTPELNEEQFLILDNKKLSHDGIETSEYRIFVSETTSSEGKKEDSICVSDSCIVNFLLSMKGLNNIVSKNQA